MDDWLKNWRESYNNKSMHHPPDDFFFCLVCGVDCDQFLFVRHLFCRESRVSVEHNRVCLYRACDRVVWRMARGTHTCCAAESCLNNNVSSNSTSTSSCLACLSAGSPRCCQGGWLATPRSILRFRVRFPHMAVFCSYTPTSKPSFFVCFCYIWPIYVQRSGKVQKRPWKTCLKEKGLAFRLSAYAMQIGTRLVNRARHRRKTNTYFISWLLVLCTNMEILFWQYLQGGAWRDWQWNLVVFS